VDFQVKVEWQNQKILLLFRSRFEKKLPLKGKKILITAGPTYEV
jgi:phosphopantothenoylcysteine synthetase/decarboxylase